MKRKSFGVAKWSSAAERHERRVGERIDERLGGAGEVLVAEHDEHRQSSPWPGVAASSAAAATSCRRRAPPGRCRAGEQGPRSTARPGCCRSAAASTPRATIASWGSSRNRLAPTPATTRRLNRSGCSAASVSSTRAPIENPIASARPSGSCAATSDSSRVIGGRVVGLVGLTVAEQVDADDLAPGVLQQVDPTVVSPRPGRRGREAVQQHHRSIGHSGIVGAGGRHARGQPLAADPARRARMALHADRWSGRPACQPFDTRVPRCTSTSRRRPRSVRASERVSSLAFGPTIRVAADDERSQVRNRAVGATATGRAARACVADREATRGDETYDCGSSSPVGGEASSWGAEATEATTERE